MAPREILAEQDDEEMIPLTSTLGEPNEGTSLLVMMPQKKQEHRRRNTWTTRVQEEIIEQSKTFLPELQSMVLSKIPWFITLRILGEMDGDGVELAAAALATTLCNVTGMSLCVGFSFVEGRYNFQE